MHIISKTDELADACKRLARHDYTTVDTEFLRESTFWPILCLIQLAGPDEAMVVDVKAEGLDHLAGDREAQLVRRDSLGWARYGFGSDAEVGARLSEIAAIAPGYRS